MTLIHGKKGTSLNVTHKKTGSILLELTTTIDETTGVSSIMQGFSEDLRESRMRKTQNGEVAVPSSSRSPDALTQLIPK